MNPQLLLCDCLSGDDSPVAVERLRRSLAGLDAPGWDRLTAAAEGEMLAPALWPALRRKGLAEDLPVAAAGRLQRRNMLNTIVNERIRDEARRVAALSEGLGVRPVILKGGVHLFEVEGDMLGARVMRDLDFLLPAEAAADLAGALSEAGYRPREEPSDDWTYTHPGLQRPGGPVAVELHHRVGQQRSLLPVEAALAAARPLAAEPRLRALSPTHRVWHNVFHSQVQDQGHALGLLWLRQLVDLAEIFRRHGSDVDWPELERVMAAAGLSGVLRARLHQAERLLGVPWPLDGGAGAAARLRHSRARLLLRAPRAMALTRAWGALTAPFKKHHIDLIYGCGTSNPLKVTAARLRHAGLIARRYRGALLQRFLLKRRYDV
jgi:hypothetical protein